MATGSPLPSEERQKQGDGRPFMVVLTGGPSSGKSSALALLRDRLTSRGFQVLTVPENATHFLANSEGFQPEWAGTDSQVRMQRIFLEFQMAQEEAFKAFAQLHPAKRAVLLLDCCTINSKVYVSEAQWEKVLTLAGHEPFTEQALFARYDLVVSLQTSAFEGHYEYGPGSNNPGRYHTPEQAKEQDLRCLEVFRKHPQLRVVPHCPNFNDKIEKVVEFVNDALQIEGLTGRRRRRTCQITQKPALEALLQMATTSASLVTSTFVDGEMRHSVRRRARLPNQVWLDVREQLEKRRADAAPSAAYDSAGDVTACLAQASTCFYERRDAVVCPSGQQKSYLTRRVISKEDYYLALESNTGKDTSSVTKLVLRFLDGSQYYELFFFLGRKELILDFSAEAGSVPRFLELGEHDLQPEASALSSAPAAALPGPGPEPKKRRVLRPHSTEEAAFGGY